MARQAVKINRKTKRAIWLSILAVFVAALLGFGIWAVVKYSSYENTPDTYGLYKASPAYFEDLVELLKKKASDGAITEMTIYSKSNYRSTGDGNRVSITAYAAGEYTTTPYTEYSEAFSDEIISAINAVFKKSTAITIKLVRDINTNSYEIDFIEGLNKIDYLMYLSYISKPDLTTEDAMKTYYGKAGDRIMYTFNDNWYFVQNMI